jgi:hypothetical protein
MTKLAVAFLSQEHQEMSEDDTPHNESEGHLGERKLGLFLSSTDAIPYWQKRAMILDE